MKFKHLDYQNVPDLEFRFYGDDLDSLHVAADRLMAQLRRMPELKWIHSDYENPRPIVDVRLDPVTSAQLGISRTGAAAALTLAAGDFAAGSIWEGDYEVPVVLKTKRSARSPR